MSSAEHDPLAPLRSLQVDDEGLLLVLAEADTGRDVALDVLLDDRRIWSFWTERDTAVAELRKIPGVTVFEPRGALYVFPRLDPDVYRIKDDQQFALDLLESERILITQGTGFNWPDPDHLRIVTLPWARDLSDAIQRLGQFLSTYEQGV